MNIGAHTPDIVHGLGLRPNHPNPFNPATTLSFIVPGRSGDRVSTTLRIYDLTGRLVRNLLHTDLESGEHEILWDGRLDSGAPATSGIYLYRIVSGSQTVSRKMTLLK